jgi:hypothetical protein
LIPDLVVVPGILEGAALPDWERAVLLASIGVLGGTAVVIVMARQAARPLSRAGEVVLREAVVLFAAGFPALSLVAVARPPIWATAWLPFLISTACVIGAEIACHWPAASSLWRVFLAGALTVSSWAPLIYFDIVFSVRIGSPLWLTVMTGTMLILGATVAYSVYRLGRGRVRLAPSLNRENRHPLVVLLVCLGAGAVVVLRLTVLPGMGVVDQAIWHRTTEPLTWIVGFGIAVTVAILAIRSDTRPLGVGGERNLLIALAVACTFPYLAWTIYTVPAMFSLGENATVVAFRNLVFDPRFLTVGGLVSGALVLAAALLIPAYRKSVASRIALVGVISILPFAALNVAGAFGNPGIPAAGPAEIAAGLAVSALAMSAWNAASGRPRVSPSALVRLSVGAILVASVAIVLDLPTFLGRVLLVAGVLLAFLWLMPKTAADRLRHGRNLVIASGSQLLVVVLFLLVDPLVGTSTLYDAMFWMFAIVVAVISIDTRTIEDPADGIDQRLKMPSTSEERTSGRVAKHPDL